MKTPVQTAREYDVRPQTSVGVYTRANGAAGRGDLI